MLWAYTGFTLFLCPTVPLSVWNLNFKFHMHNPMHIALLGVLISGVKIKFCIITVFNAFTWTIWFPEH